MSARLMAHVTALALFLTIASHSSAQQAASFEQLQMLVRMGDKITVTPADGAAVKGKIVELSPSSLRLLSNGSEHVWSQADVLQIKQRRGDPLANGAKIGGLIGLGLGTFVAITWCSWSRHADSCAAGAALSVAVYSGLGAGVGVGFDALIVRTQTVYQRPARTAGSRVHVSASVQNRVQGVAVSVSF